MTVNEWHPEPDCSACKRAEEIMYDMTRRRIEAHGIAMNMIRQLSARIEELEEGIRKHRDHDPDSTFYPDDDLYTLLEH